MSSLFSKPKLPPAPTPPPAPELTGFYSEITGVERIPVKGKNGLVTIIERQILNDAQKATIAKLEQISNQQLSRIEKLVNNFQISDIDGLSPIIDKFKLEAKNMATDAYTKRENIEEQMLARSGLEDSSSASILRRTRGQDLEATLLNANQQALNLEQDARQAELANSYALYNSVNSKMDSNLKNALNNLDSATAIQQGLMSSQNQYNNNLYNAAIERQKLQMQNSSSPFSNLLGLTGFVKGMFSPQGTSPLSMISKFMPSSIFRG